MCVISLSISVSTTPRVPYQHATIDPARPMTTVHERHSCSSILFTETIVVSRDLGINSSTSTMLAERKWCAHMNISMCKLCVIKAGTRHKWVQTSQPLTSATAYAIIMRAQIKFSVTSGRRSFSLQQLMWKIYSGRQGPGLARRWDLCCYYLAKNASSTQACPLTLTTFDLSAMCLPVWWDCSATIHIIVKSTA